MNSQMELNERVRWQGFIQLEGRWIAVPPPSPPLLYETLAAEEAGHGAPLITFLNQLSPLKPHYLLSRGVSGRDHFEQGFSMMLKPSNVS